MTVKEAVTPGLVLSRQDGRVGAQSGSPSLALGRAAQELDLKRGELDLAVQLGHVRTTPGASGGPPRVDQQEVDRLRGAEGFPDALRERVRTVGTVEGARLISISSGALHPARPHRPFHADPVLSEPLPRGRLALSGRRAQRFRARPSRPPHRPDPTRAAGRCWMRVRTGAHATGGGGRLGLLLRATEDPWERAAAIASVLDPVTVAEVATDPYERSHLRVLRPELVPGPPGVAGRREVVERLLLADHPDEILWHRVNLADALREARELRPAPRPGAKAPGLRPKSYVDRSARSRRPRGRGLLRRLRASAERCQTRRLRFRSDGKSTEFTPSLRGL